MKKKFLHPLLRLAHISDSLRDEYSPRDDNEEDFRNYQIYLPVRLGNVTSVAMMDSGNLWRTAVSWEFAQKMGLNKRDLKAIPGYGKIGTAAKNGALDVMGETIRKIRLNLGGGTRDLLCRPVVIRNLSMPLNVSGPFMKRNGIDLLHTGEAVVQGRKIAMQTKQGDFRKMADAHSLIYTTEDVTVNPMERCWIPAVAKSVKQGEFEAKALVVVGDGSYAEKYDLHPMTNAYVNCGKDGSMHVLTLNTTGHKVRVKKGSLYGIGLQTTTPKEMSSEPWKMCLIEPNLTDDVNQTMTGKIPKCQTTIPDKKPKPDFKEWKKENKIPADFDFHLESYLGGQNKLPEFMVGPTTSKNRQKRIAYLLKFFKLDKNEFLTDEKDLLATIKLLLDYFDIWAFDGNYGFTHLIEHKINLEPGTQPIHERYRPPNPLLEDSMRKQLDTWLEHGVIEKSNSPWK